MNLIKNKKSIYDNPCKCLNTLVVFVSIKLYYKKSTLSIPVPLGHIWLLGDKKKSCINEILQVFDLVDSVFSICEAILKCVCV